MNPALKAVLRHNFFSFARNAIRELEGTKLGDEPYLRYLADQLDRFAEDEIRRLIINLPPGHLKTLLGSVSLTAWMLAHDPSLKIILITHAEHLSKTIARNIRSILQSSWFRDVFTSRIKKGHAEVTDFGTTSGGGVFVASFRGNFTGRRADVIIVDDPHDISDEIEEIESTIESFDRVLLSRLNHRKTGRVLVVAHRVHERDLSAYLMQQKNWKQVVLPLIATRDDMYETSSGTWRRLKGDLLRPDAFSRDDVVELRASSFNPDFEMLYQQDFESLALPAIRADHFGTYTERPPSGAVVLSVDAGMTNRQRSAYSVIQAWGMADDRYYLLDQFREQTDFTDLRDSLRHFRKVYRPVAILIERAANGHALISDLTRKYGKLVVPIDPDGRSKSARLRAHAATIIANGICLPAHAPWRNDFIKEFVAFPNGKFTDQVDATTQFLDHAGEFADLKPTPRAGMAAAVYGSGRRRTLAFFSTGHERGLVVGVRSNGQPVTGSQRIVPFPVVKSKVIF
jgi:predicted phage terminase large subunit-like protein